MAGIADSPVAPIQLNSAEQAGNFAVSPAVGDLMSGFKSGFITAEDIQKRANAKPLENAQQQQDLADANLIRPRARELAGQQIGNASKKASIDSQSLDKQAEIQPKLDDASLFQAGELLASAERGQDKGAILNFYQTVANPGQLPPRIDANDPTRSVQREPQRQRSLFVTARRPARRFRRSSLPGCEIASSPASSVNATSRRARLPSPCGPLATA